MSDLTGNGTRSVKKRMPDSRLFALRLIVVLSLIFISTMKGYREGEEPRNRSAKMRRVMCVKTITRVLTEKCYADAVTRES